jgi:D-3-phosphoglycerate dehydrogenase / 2-oxoglutarate reductase
VGAAFFLSIVNEGIMSKIKTYNKISEDGLTIVRKSGYEVSDLIENPDAILLRSEKLHDMTIEKSLKAIGRAGAGVNNIPVDKCTAAGVVVFNSPGANANAVKELVLAGLFLSSRDISAGITYAKSLKGNGNDVNTLVEKNKSRFSGIEISGKRLAVVGLGAIGVMVANAALDLGMIVNGYDPFISVDKAWGLSSSVGQAGNLNKLLAEADFISLHMPLTDTTKDFINKTSLSKMKTSATILNFARPEIVNQEAIVNALNNNKLHRYVTDFPSDLLLSSDKVIPIPHLGASTKEAEDNCAVMIAKQLKDYLEFGNILNSVNFPSAILDRTGDYRLAIIHSNVPNMVGQITAAIAHRGLNISEMLNKSRQTIAYTLVDINGEATCIVEDLVAIEGIQHVRLIK